MVDVVRQRFVRDEVNSCVFRIRARHPDSLGRRFTADWIISAVWALPYGVPYDLSLSRIVKQHLQERGFVCLLEYLDETQELG